MRYGRIYYVNFQNVTVSALQDLFEIAPADDKPVLIHSVELANVGADVGDAEEEMLRLQLIRNFTNSGSGGTVVTTIPRQYNTDTAAGFTAETNNTTVAATGTTQILWAGGWNIRVPFEKVWLPESRPVCTQAQNRIVFKLMAAPADAISMSGTMTVEEIG